MRCRLLLAGVVASLAGSSAASDLSDAAPGNAGVTAFDLARLVVTDLKRTADGAAGSKVVRFRHIEGKSMLAAPGDAITLGDSAVDIIPVPGSSDRVMALIDLGQSEGNVEEADLLGLYALTPKLRLLDVVEVGNDRETGVEDDLPLLAPGAPLIVVDSGHSNSNESYNDAEMIFIRGDRFQLIDNHFTYSMSVCSFSRTQTATYSVAPTGAPYRAVTLSVREETTLSHEDGCSGEGKPPKAGVKTYIGTYVWDAAHARYVTHSAALKALDALNAERVQSGG